MVKLSDVNSRKKRQAFYDIGVDSTDFITLSIKATDLGMSSCLL